MFDASLGAADLGFESVDSGEIATDAVNGSEVAASAIDSDEILDNSLTASRPRQRLRRGTAEIGTGAVTNAELGDNSVAVIEDRQRHSIHGVRVLAGGESNGAITLNAGFVANGRCRDVGISVRGAQARRRGALLRQHRPARRNPALRRPGELGDVVIVGKACNLTGAPFPQLNGIQVRS